MEEEIKTPIENAADNVEDQVNQAEDKKEEFKEEFKEKAEEFKEEFKEDFKEAKEKIADALETEDETSGFEEKDINANKVMAIIAYLGILVVIPIFAAKDSKFARFHANQGLILLIAFLICSVISVIPIVGIFGWVIDIILIVFMVKGIINAASGSAKRLPYIGKYEILK